MVLHVTYLASLRSLTHRGCASSNSASALPRLTAVADEVLDEVAVGVQLRQGILVETDHFMPYRMVCSGEGAEAVPAPQVAGIVVKADLVRTIATEEPPSPKLQILHQGRPRPTPEPR